MILFQKLIFREDLRSNRDVLYVFGDNDARAGLGGQAREMRGEPNAVGVRTKVAPSSGAPYYYYSDAKLAQNIQKIHEDLSPLYDHLDAGGVVVFPLDGLGTGLAELDKRAPKTFAYLDERVKILVSKYSTSKE